MQSVRLQAQAFGLGLQPVTTGPYLFELARRPSPFLDDYERGALTHGAPVPPAVL